MQSYPPDSTQAIDTNLLQFLYTQPTPNTPMCCDSRLLFPQMGI